MRLANACFWSSIFYTTTLFCRERGEWGCGACHKVRAILVPWPGTEPVSVPCSGTTEPPRRSLHTHLMMWSSFFFQTISLHDSFLCHFHAPSKLHFISLSAQYKSPCSFLNQKALIESLNISLYIYPLKKKKKHCFKGRSLGKAFLFESWNRKTHLG